MHSCTTERKKDLNWFQKTNFLANGKSLNHFDYKQTIIFKKSKIYFKNQKSILKDIINKILILKLIFEVDFWN